MVKMIDLLVSSDLAAAVAFWFFIIGTLSVFSFLFFFLVF
jgi:hypothetical protein